MWKKVSGTLSRCCKAISSKISKIRVFVSAWIKRQSIRKWLIGLIQKNRTLAVIAVFAVTFSLIGYMIGGLSIFEGLYAAAALFFVNPVTDVNNVLVMFGKYLSLAVSAGVILNVVKYAFKLAGHYRINQYQDSTAVYTDNPWGEQVAERIKHGYISEGKKNGELENAKHHIFMYFDDMKNLNLYATHKDELSNEGAHAYIMLTHVDSFLLNGENSNSGEEPRYFNIYDMLAREYWKDHNLFEEAKKSKQTPVRVAIIGYEEVGQAICKYAILNNVYWPDQAIEYHVWGCKPYQAQFLQRIDLMNGDKIITHEGYCLDDLEQIKKMYRIILTEKDNTEALQQLLYVAPDSQIHVYIDGEIDLTKLYMHSAGKLVCFGNLDAILTEQNIKQEELYHKAKLLNYDYKLLEAGIQTMLPDNYRQEMDNEWRKLSGFLKGSNIARADHLWIEKRFRQGPEKMDDGVIGVLEHIRWCRFHFYNHWSFAPELTNQDPNKDKVRRRHGLLTSDLPDNEKGKDKIFNDKLKVLLEKTE